MTAASSAFDRALDQLGAAIVAGTRSGCGSRAMTPEPGR